jgi:membrane fusion protein (multidrug efflux system)
MICSGSALSGCSVESKTVKLGEAAATNSSPSPAPRRPLAVEVFEIKPHGAASDQLIPAVISVEGTATVLARRDGIINWLGGQEGTRVTQGEVIIRLDDDEARANLRQAELEVNRIQVEEKQYEAMIKVNQSELDRQVALAKDGVVSRSGVDHAQYKFEVSQQELEKTRFATQSARGRVETAKLELEKASVRATITGLIAHRYVKLGTGVVRGDKLFEVSQLEPLEVRFQITQGERPPLALGNIVNLSLAESGRVVAKARVRRVDPVVDAVSNSLGYLADVIEGAGLLPGSAVYVRIPPAASGSALRIPRAAFPATAELRFGASASLFVLEGEKCAVRTVWVTLIESDQVEISYGLAIGDRVIIAPPAELKAGDVVEVITG